MVHNPFEHVMDQDRWEFFSELFGGVHLELPGFDIFGHHFQLTKFMILELVAALLAIAIFVPLGQRAKTGEPPRGLWWNMFESLLTFIRNDVAKPNLGDHDADHHVGFLWTLFIFILFCNLLGMFPFLGSPTADIRVTGTLAAISFVAMIGAAVAKMGPGHYLKSLWPNLDVPIPVLGIIIKALICLIEIVGRFIKTVVLAVRLFANMFAGHTVLAMILGFIILTGSGVIHLWLTVTGASVLGVTALSLLELFVAFLQAYIFVFLTALFMGMELHPH